MCLKLQHAGQFWPLRVTDNLQNSQGRNGVFNNLTLRRFGPSFPPCKTEFHKENDSLTPRPSPVSAAFAQPGRSINQQPAIRPLKVLFLDVKRRTAHVQPVNPAPAQRENRGGNAVHIRPPIAVTAAIAKVFIFGQGLGKSGLAAGMTFGILRA